MSLTRRAARGGTVLGALALTLALPLALVACAPADTTTVSPASAEEQVLIYPDVVVTDNIAYGPGAAQRLDVCQPADPEVSALNNGPRRAIVSVHGGSWREGDKASLHWRSVCEWLASEGFIAFSLNYSLAPTAPYPAGITDVQSAVEWLRQPEQVAQYDIDPTLIGAFGGSAGGNLVTLLGASGSGSQSVGSRVAAVVELSAPIDLTGGGVDGYTDEFKQYQLDYLGCDRYEECPVAKRASPDYWIDASDPPMFIGHSRDEFIPVSQAETLVTALTQSGVAHEFVEVAGRAHSIGMLDDGLRAEIVEFLRGAL